jgi:hypothetical protein
MNRNHVLLAALILLVMIAGSACAPVGAGPVQPANESANQPAVQQQPTAAPVIPPTMAQQPAAPAPTEQPAASPQFAPVCQSAAAVSPAEVQQVEIGCVDKVPYTNVLVAANTQYEVLDKTGTFKCSDSGMVVDGKTVLTCYGKPLYTFDLKLSGSGPGSTAPSTGTDQCQQGYGYDAAQQCCAPLSASASGSSTVQINLGACPLPRHQPGGWSKPLQ